MRRLASLLLVLAGHAGFAYGHAIHAGDWSGASAVAFTYSDGTAASFADVEVHAPGDAEPFQTGQTDREGRFAFAPHTGGTWKIRLDDGLGHAVEHAVVVGEAAHAPIARGARRADTLSRAFLGIGIILGGFGWWALWKSRNL